MDQFKGVREDPDQFGLWLMARKSLVQEQTIGTVLEKVPKFIFQHLLRSAARWGRMDQWSDPNEIRQFHKLVY